MSLTYNTFVTSLANLVSVPVADPGYVTALPNIIDDAEQRLYRELDLLSTIVSQMASLTAATRNFVLPTVSGNPFVGIETMNVITPFGISNPDLGLRVPLLPVSKEFLDMTWPSAENYGIPTYMAPLNQTTWILGPWPDQNYAIEVTGWIRPLPLSNSNQTTFLSQYLPDVFLAAAAVFASGYQQNFSAMGDNPAQSLTWEAHVKPLIDSAKVEEIRKRFASQGWSSKSPDPIATPPRT